MSNYQEEEFQDQKVDLGTWKQILHYVAPYKKNMILIACSMLVCGVMDVAMPYLNSYAIDNFIMKKSAEGLIPYGAFYLAAVIVAAFAVYFFCRQAGMVETYVCHNIRKTGFTRLQELSFNYYDKTAVGYMLARMTSDAQRLGETIAWSLVDIAWGAFYMIACLLGMFVRNWKLTLIICAFLPVMGLVSVYFQKRILANHRAVRRANSMITGAYNEGIMGARTTKTLVREELNAKEFNVLAGNMRRSSIHAAMFSAVYWPVISVLGTVSTALVIWKGGSDVMRTAMTVGELAFFIQLSGSFFEPVLNVARIFADLQSSQAAAERVISLINTEPQIQDRPDVIEKYGDAFDPKKENWEPVRGEVEFDHVSFRYVEDEEVLKDFSLHVKAGENIALVGETGSGKSTIVNLICRFYEPTEGRILIDGTDYRERSQLWLHSSLGYVLQSPHLFSGTVADNIRYGRLDATDEEVQEAAKLVGADEFIRELDKGYDTDVGEGGGRLSTGQKQLISFARAIIANPAIFVLDEATSSIDTETEVRIQRAIEKILSGRTSFIVAHRLSTIRNADRILVISNGEVIESGTHKELMAARGHYYSLYTNQFRTEQENALLGTATVYGAQEEAEAGQPG